MFYHYSIFIYFYTIFITVRQSQPRYKFFYFKVIEPNRIY